MTTKTLVKCCVLAIISSFSASVFSQEINNPDIRCTVSGNGVATDTTAQYKSYRSVNGNLGVIYTDWGYSNFGNPGILVSLGGHGAINDISPNLEMRQPRPRSTTSPQSVDTIDIFFLLSYEVITLGGVLPYPNPSNFPFNRRNPTAEQTALLDQARDIARAFNTTLSRQALLDGYQSSVEVPTYDANTRTIDSVSAVLSCGYASSVTLPAPVASPCSIRSEATYSLKNKKSGRYLNISGASLADGGNAITWGTTGNHANSRFVAINEGNGWYSFEAVHSRRHLNISGNSTRDGANVIQWGFNSRYENSQFRVYESDGACRIEARHSGKCLATRNGGTRNGTNVEQHSCHLGNEARWYLEKY